MILLPPKTNNIINNLSPICYGGWRSGKIEVDSSNGNVHPNPPTFCGKFVTPFPKFIVVSLPVIRKNY